MTAIVGQLSISGWRTWVLATLVVWMVTTLAPVLLPLMVRRKSTSPS